MRLSVGFDEDEVAGPEGLDSPVLLVEQMVVIPAGEQEVVEFGATEIRPVNCVMGVTGGGSDGAVADAAAVVSGDELVEETVGDGSGLAAVVEGGAVGGVDQTVDAGVAGESLDGVGGDDDAAAVGVEAAAGVAGEQVVVGDRGDDLGP